jgi:hypothetical protein
MTAGALKPSAESTCLHANESRAEASGIIGAEGAVVSRSCTASFVGRGRRAPRERGSVQAYKWVSRFWYVHSTFRSGSESRGFACARACRCQKQILIEMFFGLLRRSYGRLRPGP